MTSYQQHNLTSGFLAQLSQLLPLPKGLMRFDLLLTLADLVSDVLVALMLSGVDQP